MKFRKKIEGEELKKKIQGYQKDNQQKTLSYIYKRQLANHIVYYYESTLETIDYHLMIVQLLNIKKFYLKSYLSGEQSWISVT